MGGQPLSQRLNDGEVVGENSPFPLIEGTHLPWKPLRDLFWQAVAHRDAALFCLPDRLAPPG
jgi:hypothetical protein